ncbi:hypothetical protein NX059_011756 [Plenodomus lindquistii]|nr:hypothetical protein NX059_011756 [Plenodomus lindquistii]
MEPYKNVLLIGAGGSLGTPMLNAFAARPDYTVTILTRNDSTATFPPGARVIKAIYVSLNSLIAAFKDQDVVISLIGGHALNTQFLFIEAAVRAGVKHFIPSEFGPNSRNEEFAKINDVVLPARAAVVDFLKSKEGQGAGRLRWTSVICGGFFEWMLYDGMLGFDLPNRHVTLIDGGNSPATFTTLVLLGKAVVAILDHADQTANHYVFTESFTVSPKEMLEWVEKVDGKKWSVSHTTYEKVLATGRKAIENGDLFGIKDLTRSAAFGRLGLGDERGNGFWNERLSLEKEDLEEEVRKVLRDQGLLKE